jgi:hypothetical protein
VTVALKGASWIYDVTASSRRFWIVILSVN